MIFDTATLVLKSAPHMTKLHTLDPALLDACHHTHRPRGPGVDAPDHLEDVDHILFLPGYVQLGGQLPRQGALGLPELLRDGDDLPQLTSGLSPASGLPRPRFLLSLTSHLVWPRPRRARPPVPGRGERGLGQRHYHYYCFTLFGRQY